MRAGVSSCRGPGIINLTRIELSRLKVRRPSFAIGRVAQGYSQLMHGKGACHLISPILWLSALARSAWWNGMSHDGDIDGVRLIWMSPHHVARNIRLP